MFYIVDTWKFRLEQFDRQTSFLRVPRTGFSLDLGQSEARLVPAGRREDGLLRFERHPANGTLVGELSLRFDASMGGRLWLPLAALNSDRGRHRNSPIDNFCLNFISSSSF